MQLLTHILKTTAELSPFQTIYHLMEASNKVHVTELYDITDCEDDTLQTETEREVNQMLEFDVDDWGEAADDFGLDPFSDIFNTNNNGQDDDDDYDNPLLDEGDTLRHHKITGAAANADRFDEEAASEEDADEYYFALSESASNALNNRYTSYEGVLASSTAADFFDEPEHI